jgi:hypothetical protein
MKPALLMVCLLAFPALLPVQAKERIQKCQDAEGRWHYGQHAAAECAGDKTITTIDERGLKLKEQAPPPTVEELEARKEAQARKKEEERKAAARRAADQKLLYSYESEEALLQARDSQLNSMDNVLRGNRKLLESRYAQRAKLLQQLTALQGKDAETALKQLSTIKTEIAEFEAATTSREADRAQIIERFEQDLARYRELKGTAPRDR